MVANEQGELGGVEGRDGAPRPFRVQRVNPTCLQRQKS
jgi:hypothetical protein